ncbi:MAG: hypothetical protein ACJA02_000385 [Myxococcota bacterium]|jgi:hypothetical protein
MKNLWKLFTIISLFSFASHATSVGSASQAGQLYFGKIGPVDSVGSIGGSTNYCSPTTQVSSVGDCRGFGSFNLAVRNQGKSVSLPNKNTFRVFIETSIATINANDTELFFENIAACTNLPSLQSGFIAMDCANNSTANQVTQNWSIKVFGRISNIISAQSSATYSPNDAFAGFGCNKDGFSPNINHQKCSGNNHGVTLAPTLNAQINKNLSVSISPTNLDFGQIAAGELLSTFG